MWALPGRSELSLRQHTAMMRAIRKGDAELVAKLLRAHVTSGEATMLAQLEDRKETQAAAP